jgi:hypothetical protein
MWIPSLLLRLRAMMLCLHSHGYWPDLRLTMLVVPMVIASIITVVIPLIVTIVAHNNQI